MASSWHFDAGNLRSLINDWWNGSPSRLERMAFVKDVTALLESAPHAAGSWKHPNTSRPIRIGRYLADCVQMVKHFILPLVSARKTPGDIVSPYAGGVASPQSAPYTAAVVPAESNLKVAVFNPGRSGLMALSTEMLLEWRLWDIAAELQDNNVQICFLPGARLAQGIALPRNFPYAWLGDRSAGWDTIGALVLLEVLDRVELDTVISGGRVMFLNVHCKSGLLLHLGGFYAGQGGDEDTWSIALEYSSALRRIDAGAAVLLLADGNVHFTGLLVHDSQCSCLHCKQRPADRRIQQACVQAGFRLINEGMPTHCSGSAIDVALANQDLRCTCYTGRHRVGESDHFPVFVDFSFLSLVHDNRCQLGRVMWSTEAVWDDALHAVSSELELLCSVVREVLDDGALRPSQLGGSASKALRRNVIDAAAWTRDFLYVLAGHCAVAVIVLKPSSQALPSPQCLRPDHFDSYDGFKHAVCQNSWLEQQKATYRFLRLREADPNKAKQWISKTLSARSDVMLISPETGLPMHTSEMASVVMRDLQDKVGSCKAGVASDSSRALAAISKIRASGGFPERAGTNQRLLSGSVFVPDEVINEILDSLKSSKRWLHGTAAALKATCAQGRAVTGLLVNLAFWVGLTSSFWSLRMICPIRKCGPAVVRRLENLRPVSFGSDMAQVLDAVWVRLNKGPIESFCGPGQLGGRSDPASAILAIVLLCQLRRAQGAPTYLAIADLQAAFDLADIPTMLLNISRAGVAGCCWLLMDDILNMDKQVVCLHGHLSPVFSLGQGTAQGRRFSSFLFNAFAVNLSDAMKSALPYGTCALWPPFAHQALVQADAVFPALSLDAEPSSADTWREAIVAIQGCYEGDSPPWAASLKVAVSWLCKIPKLADRILVVDCLGRFPVGPIQYIDDTTLPCPSVGALAAVIGDNKTSACEAFAASSGSKINRKPGKTTVMAMYGSPPPSFEVIGCDLASVHSCLGFLIDDQLSMESMLSAVVAHANSALSEFCTAASCAGVPLPVIADEVPSRIESIVTFRAPFLVLAPYFEVVLNSVQHKWALEVLGCNSSISLKVGLPCVQLGWTSRLGTRVLDFAIATLARLQCLPDDHPAAVMVHAASEVTWPTWVSVIHEHMRRLRHFGWILPISEHPAFAPSVRQAKIDHAFRKHLVKQYRKQVIAPILAAYDEHCRRGLLGAYCEGLALRYEQLPVNTGALPWTLALVDLGPQTLSMVRRWLWVRCSGRWPPSQVMPTGPTLRDFCPWCGGALVSVSHALCDCDGSRQGRQALLGPRRSFTSSQEMLQFLFDLTADVDTLQACIYYVNEVLVNFPRSEAEGL